MIFYLCYIELQLPSTLLVPQPQTAHIERNTNNKTIVKHVVIKHGCHVFHFKHD